MSGRTVSARATTAGALAGAALLFGSGAVHAQAPPAPDAGSAVAQARGALERPAEVPAAAPDAAPPRAPAAAAPRAATSAPARDRPARAAEPRVVDQLELDATAITGNRELPRVMVIVPWKKSDIGDLVGKPLNSLVDEALQPVDREVFRREIAYHGALEPDRPRDSRAPDAAGSAGRDAPGTGETRSER